MLSKLAQEHLTEKFLSLQKIVVSAILNFSCIPGTIGGAVVMNSGCYGNDISKVLLSINVIDMNKFVEKEIKNDEIKFFYRGTNLSDQLIITSVKLKGEIKSKEIIELKQNDLIEKKVIPTQPDQNLWKYF